MSEKEAPLGTLAEGAGLYPSYVIPVEREALVLRYASPRSRSTASQSAAQMYSLSSSLIRGWIGTQNSRAAISSETGKCGLPVCSLRSGIVECVGGLATTEST